ncbi:zinc knuckle CX2CX4HX4C containing protein [Tanacetum coccineum]
MVSDNMNSSAKSDIDEDCVSSAEVMGNSENLCNEALGETDKSRGVCKADCNGEQGDMENGKEMSKESEETNGSVWENKNEGVNGNKKSYARATICKQDDYSRKLFVKPTKMDMNRNEFVIFDETIINEGCKKWDLTLCGYFIGHNMTVNELRYNLRRMWRRKGFKDIVDVNNGMFFIKFHTQEGLDDVVNYRPWMIPIWIRLCNVPLKAWTKNGITALASRLRKPLVMDKVTPNMCKSCVGRVGYARVLVKISANKGIPDEIVMVYRGKDKEELCRKKVQVKFDWLPSKCSSCCMFGHDDKACRNVEDVVQTDAKRNRDVNDMWKEKKGGKTRNDGFTKVRNRKASGFGSKPVHMTNLQTQKKEIFTQKGRTESQFIFKKKSIVENEKSTEVNNV